MKTDLRRLAGAVLALCLLAACGKKGPPLAPLRFVPAAAADVTAIRGGNEVRLQFVLPNANAQGQGRIDLDRVEVYAVTVAADSPNPANRDLLQSRYMVGTVQVKPLPREGEPEPPSAPQDPRPSPGEPAVFVETLTAATLAPQITTPAPTPVLPAPPPAAAAAQEPPVVRRLYVVRGLTRSGRPGQPSARVALPIIDLPAPPASLAATVTETSLTLTWTPAPPPHPAAAFNVYAVGAMKPLNPAPLQAAAFERPGVTFGTEECFVVRTAVVRGAATLESTPSEPLCVTPADTFPPAAPKGLSAVGVAGAINLIWEANTERDLAGYLILRGEAPGDTLQAITATPIRETTFRDTTVTAGVRYVYVVVAVDAATPPNTSPQSTRVEESAR